MEVLTDDDTLGAQALHEHPLDERQRRFLRLRLVERQHDGGVDAGHLEQLHPLVVIGQQLRSRLGAHDRGGVPVERDDRRAGASCGGQLAHLCDHRLMAVVEAVVGTDRDDGALVRERRESSHR